MTPRVTVTGRESCPPLAEDTAVDLEEIADRRRPPDTGRRRWSLSEPRSVVVFLLLVMVGSLLLRVEGIGAAIWMDEAISIGIASHPLAEIPRLLLQDGAPPLYYVLLHGWMKLFGQSEAATRSLSVVFAVAAVPVALWGGWSLFGRTTGLVLAVLVATNPYLNDYARETRMYSLAVLLALVATVSFLHSFAFGRRRYLPLFTASLALLLYTHNWGLWFAVAAVAALGPCLLAGGNRRRVLVDGAWSFGLAGVLYLPWLPMLLSQAANTGAPWSARPIPREAISIIAGALGDPHERVLVVLVLVAGPVLWAGLRRRGTSDVAAIGAPLVMVAGTIGVAWLSSQFKPSWAVRYVAVVVPALLLLAAVGLVRSGRRGIVGLALMLAFWIQPIARLSGERPTFSFEDTAFDRVLGRVAGPELRPGDQVVVMQMEQVPVVRYYLPDGLRFADATGPVADPTVVDWRHALTRMRHTTAPTALVPLIDRLAVGGRLLMVCPQPERLHPELAWFKLMNRRCEEWQAVLVGDPRLHPVVFDQEGKLPEEPDVLLFERVGE